MGIRIWCRQFREARVILTREIGSDSAGVGMGSKKRQTRLEKRMEFRRRKEWHLQTTVIGQALGRFILRYSPDIIPALR